MRIWKVECAHKWDENQNACDSYSFGSYDGALMWVINHADELRWASIEENDYLPCHEDNPGGQLFIGCNVTQFFDEKEIQTMKYIQDNISID